MLRLALESQLGIDAANSHYNIAGSGTTPSSPITNETPIPAATTPDPAAPNRITELEGEEGDGGMYL